MYSPTRKTSLKHFLAWVAAVTDKTRFVSRGARAKGDEDRMTPTGQFVFRLLTMGPGDPPATRARWAARAVRFAPTEAHMLEAERTISWARTTEPAFTDKVVYHARLRLLATLGEVTWETVGLAAGMYRSYKLAQQERSDELAFRKKLRNVLLPAGAGTGDDDCAPELSGV